MVTFNKINVVKGKFPNGENQYYDLSELLRYSPRNIVSLVYENNEDLFNLAMVKNWFDDHAINGTEVELRMEFCPYGQSDRKMSDAMFSFKYFANFINSLHFDQVTIYDPHSPVMEAALNKCHVEYPMTGVNLDNYDLMFYVDQGGCKKYSEIYPNKPYRFGNKKRNLDTGTIECYEIIADRKDITDKKILIRDDLCIGGRSFKEAAKALHDKGAKKIDLYITHLMSPAEDFYENHKDYYIDNFYSDNTLKMKWYKQLY